MTAATTKRGDAVERVERVNQTSDLRIDLGLGRHRSLQHRHHCGRVLRLENKTTSHAFASKSFLSRP